MSKEARELAQRFGVRMCDENGMTHGEELYCLGLDDIIAMKEALVADLSAPKQEQSLEFVEWRDVDNTGIPEPVYRLKPKQEQSVSVGEPVGVMVSMDVSKGDEPEHRIFGRIYEVQEDNDGVTYLAIEESRNFEAKQEQGEPDDEVLGFNGWGFPIEHPPKPTPATKEQIREALVFNFSLYTTPQQRTWVGLNWSDLPEEWVGNPAFMEGAKWAEAALKGKNI
jgi:hypothetical protein